LGHRQRGQAPFAEVEAAHLPEPGRALQRPGQRVRPGVVRADDRLLASALPARKQLVAAVPAAVRERPDLAILAADQQHAALAGGLGTLVAGRRQLLAARHAHPAAAEKVPLLPAEHSGVHVRRPRQHPALPERTQRQLQLTAVERCRRDRRRGDSSTRPDPKILTDHTVKTRRPGRACPGAPARQVLLQYPSRHPEARERSCERGCAVRILHAWATVMCSAASLSRVELIRSPVSTGTDAARPAPRTWAATPSARW